MEPISIRWATGYMNIDPGAFFPTSAARVRKLLRVVALDYEHQDDIRMQLVRHCTERAQAIMDGRKALANEAVNHQQKAADLQPWINLREHRIHASQACLKEQPKKARALEYLARIKAEKEALKTLKAEQRGERAACEKKKREFIQAEKDAQQLRRNAEVIQA